MSRCSLGLHKIDWSVPRLARIRVRPILFGVELAPYHKEEMIQDGTCQRCGKYKWRYV